MTSTPWVNSEWIWCWNSRFVKQFICFASWPFADTLFPSLPLNNRIGSFHYLLDPLRSLTSIEALLSLSISLCLYRFSSHCQVRVVLQSAVSFWFDLQGLDLISNDSISSLPLWGYCQVSSGCARSTSVSYVYEPKSFYPSARLSAILRSVRWLDKNIQNNPFYGVKQF